MLVAVYQLIRGFGQLGDRLSSTPLARLSLTLTLRHRIPDP